MCLLNFLYVAGAGVLWFVKENSGFCKNKRRKIWWLKLFDVLLHRN